jgi:hypothetical protein
MSAQEYTSSNSGQSVILGGNFSADEVARLTRLRSDVSQLPDWFDCSEDGARLEFARWLYDHGKLTDE